MDRVASEAYLRKLIAISPLACVLTDPRRPDNPIVATNAAFRALTGYAEAELIGHNCRMLTGPETEDAPRAALRAAVAEGRATVVELTNHRRDGSPFRNAVMIAPMVDDGGRLIFFMGSQMAIGPGGLDERREAARARIAHLSPRQAEVLRHMARGLRHAEIAAALGVTEKTVKMHRGALVTRLGCRTSAEAIRLAVEAGF